MTERNSDPLDRRDPQGWPEPQGDQPDEDSIAAMVIDAAPRLATDGCEVEPDGFCPHGHPSWPVRLGVH